LIRVKAHKMIKVGWSERDLKVIKERGIPQSAEYPIRSESSLVAFMYPFVVGASAAAAAAAEQYWIRTIRGKAKLRLKSYWMRMKMFRMCQNGWLGVV